MTAAATDLQVRGELGREQIELLKRTICAGATDDELALFVQTSKRLSLDPFARQVFAVKRWDNKKRVEVMAIQVSIDGFRLVAERTGKYAGQLGPLWTKDGKEWVEVWLSKEPPAAAKVAVLRVDFKEPLWAVATWDQYKQEGREGLTPMWKRMGPLMLAKCAESLALRRAFPNELSGVYTAEEMAQAETPDYQPPTRAAEPAARTLKIELEPPPGPSDAPPPNVPAQRKDGPGAWPKAVGERKADIATANWMTSIAAQWTPRCSPTWWRSSSAVSMRTRSRSPTTRPARSRATRRRPRRRAKKFTPWCETWTSATSRTARG